MCGIVGSHGKKAAELDLQLLKHRGPDGWDIADLGHGTLGHTRLAIIDVQDGQQPLYHKERTLVCNGEIYNHKDVRAQFPDFDYTSDSDNEVILALYDAYGKDAVRHLDGMFAFALVNEDDEIYMARDPLGIKPLYYGWQDGTLWFSSELKSLIDKVDNVEEFPPGHWYTPEDGLVPYYDLNQIQQDIAIASPAEPTPEDIHQALKKAVQKRLMSDVPLGVYLSGGLDSTIVAALVAQEKPDLHSFSVGIEGSMDIANAREAAKALGTNHHEYIYTFEEMLEHLPDILYYLESFDPSLVRSAIPNFFLARLTQQYVTVVLTGEGADELFAGYHYLKEFSDSQSLQDELVTLTKTLYNCNLQRCDRMTMAHSIEGRVPFLDTEFIELAMRVPTQMKIHGDEAVEKWVLRKAFEDILPESIAWRVKEQFSKGAGSSHLLEEHAEATIADAEFEQEIADVEAQTGYQIRSKEELLYHREFVKHFGMNATRLIQPWKGHDVAVA